MTFVHTPHSPSPIYTMYHHMGKSFSKYRKLYASPLFQAKFIQKMFDPKPNVLRSQLILKLKKHQNQHNPYSTQNVSQIGAQQIIQNRYVTCFENTTWKHIVHKYFIWYRFISLIFQIRHKNFVRKWFYIWKK